MSTEKKEMYVGNGRTIGNNGIKVQIDLTALWEFTKGQAKDKIKTWKDKNGNEHKSIDLVIFPLKPENQTEYRTHSVKVDDFVPDPNYKKTQGQNQMQPIKVTHEDEMPF